MKLTFDRTRSLQAAGVVAAALVAVAFLVWGAHMGRAGETGAGTLWPPSAGSIVVWSHGRGSLTATLTNAAGVATDSSLGAGSAAQLVAGGSRPVVLVSGTGGGHRLVRYAPATRTWATIAASLEPADMTTAVIARNLVYLPVGQGRRAAVIAVDLNTGRTTARLRLPVLVPNPGALLTLPARSAGTRAAGRGRVAALLAAGDHVLAISATPLAAAVTDLTSHASVSLAGYTHVAAATVGGDGIVYILAGRADPAFTLRFLRVDPRSMRLVSVWDTGVAATDEPVSALPTRFGAVFYAPGLPHSLDAYSGTNVWLVDGSGAHQNSAVSSNIGLHMGPGRGDSVLFYGSPAGGVVSRLDTDDGSLDRRDTRLVAPSGAPVVLAAD
jgi:hypothetical protein